MGRKEGYKHKAKSAAELRAKRRAETKALRNKARERLLKAKRVRHSTSISQGDDDYSTEQVHGIAVGLVEKSNGERVGKLKTLRKAFAQGTALIDAFLEVDNAMASLVGLLTGTDAELQLAAAWCLTNIASGTDKHANAVLDAAGPYLISLLCSGNAPLQDQCAWALGNLAGDSQNCRDVLIAQGATKALVDLLQSSLPTVVRSALFALSNLARGEKADARSLVEHGVIAHLGQHLEYDVTQMEITTEAAWVLTYIAASGDHTDALVEAGIVEKLASLIIAISDVEQDSDHTDLLTPSLRALGNLSTGPASSARAQKCEGLIAALGKLLNSEHHFVRKECLWALSNLTSIDDVCQQLQSLKLLESIVKLLGSTFDIKTEAAYCVVNIASHSQGLVQELVSLGTMEHITPLLKSQEAEVAHLALCFTEMALRQTENGKLQFECHSGRDGLEVLEYHQNEQLRGEANLLLDTYFYPEDEKNASEEEKENETTEDSASNGQVAPAGGDA